MQRSVLCVSSSHASLRCFTIRRSATRTLGAPLHAKHSRSSRTHCSSTATASRSSEPPVDRQTKLTPKEVDEALRAAEQLLDSIVAGGGAPTMASVELGYTEYTDFEFACDESGCVLAVQQQDSKHAQSSKNQACAPVEHIEDRGCRLCRQFAASIFQCHYDCSHGIIRRKSIV
jgi:hypothetical protein